MAKWTRPLFVLSTVLLLAVMLGCGTEETTEAFTPGNSQTGVAFRINWPAPASRMFPSAAQSLTITLRLGQTVADAQHARRPGQGGTTFVEFRGLPPGTFTAALQAFPNADGTGNAQAAANPQVNVTLNQIGTVTVDLNSTVTSFAITPNPLGLVMEQPGTDVVATGRDAGGGVVLLPPVTWSITAGAQFVGLSTTQPTLLPVTLSPLAVGGPATVRATLEQQAGVPATALTATLNVNVSPVGQGPGVTTIAGSGEAGFVDGPGAVARFNNPVNVALAPNGSLFVADFDNGLVRQVEPDGTTSTIVNQGNFFRPFGITFGPDGELYVMTDRNTFDVGGGVGGTVWRVNIPGRAANVVAENIGRPRGMCAMPVGGGLLLADDSHAVISHLDTTTGVVTRLAGQPDQFGLINGTGDNARFNRPTGMAALPDGTVLVADSNNNCLRRLTFSPDGSQITDVSTFAGDGTAGLVNGPRAGARFFGPGDVDTDAAGNAYVADGGNHVLRLIVPGGDVSTLAGTGVQGFLDGALLSAQFFGFEGLAVRPDGSIVYIPDGNFGTGDPFNRIRQVRLIGG
ncbi:MAG: hypothetical protein HYU66_29055 [Armatimonadetes bacterium]|nr:hypothetical protein [Armatimonadota bacterium]